jgi:hypothetical protein
MARPRCAAIRCHKCWLGVAAFALRGDPIAAGQARFFCIFIGVAIGTTFVLILASDRLRDIEKRLLERIWGGGLPRARRGR